MSQPCWISSVFSNLVGFRGFWGVVWRLPRRGGVALLGPRMKILFVGGTGFISTAVSRLALARGWELFLLNRGQHHPNPPGCRSLVADINRADEVRAALGDTRFDVIVDWVAYAPNDIERDLALFRGRAGQYVFISSASVYQKPPAHYLITESTPLCNPHWGYSRNKIACEERLMRRRFGGRVSGDDCASVADLRTAASDCAGGLGREPIVHVGRAVVHRACLRHVLESRVTDLHRLPLVVHVPGVAEGRAVAGAVVLRQRFEVVAGVVLRIGVARSVAVGNLLRARERVPTVLRQQLVRPALVNVLHAVHGVVLAGAEPEAGHFNSACLTNESLIK